MTSDGSTLALVEGAGQLLDVLELAHASDGGEHDLGALRVAVLAPSLGRAREQLRATVALARAEGLDVGWHEPRSGGASVARTVRCLLEELGPTRRLVVADPFSGVPQVLVGLVRPTHLTVVDHGTATDELVTHLAGLRLRRAAERPTRLRVFTTAARAAGPAPADVEVRRNAYAWLRARWPHPEVHPGADLVGAPLVEAGAVDLTTYLAAVDRLVRQEGVTRYLAHPGESDAKLERVRALGVVVVRPVLPLEITLRSGPVGRSVIAFPTLGVHTLPVVLAGSGVRTYVSGVAEVVARAVC